MGKGYWHPVVEKLANYLEIPNFFLLKVDGYGASARQNFSKTKT